MHVRLLLRACDGGAASDADSSVGRWTVSPPCSAIERWILSGVGQYSTQCIGSYRVKTNPPTCKCWLPCGHWKSYSCWTGRVGCYIGYCRFVSFCISTALNTSSEWWKAEQDYGTWRRVIWLKGLKICTETVPASFRSLCWGWKQRSYGNVGSSLPNGTTSYDGSSTVSGEWVYGFSYLASGCVLIWGYCMGRYITV
jgi:hypothetical protein